MKPIPFLFASFLLVTSSLFAQKAEALDVLSLETIPEGNYDTTLSLKQKEGVPAKVTLEVKGGTITGNGDRLGNLTGKILGIGNGVFMVQLRGNDYVATQFWVFQQDGSAQINEVPDRGEKQVAVAQALNPNLGEKRRSWLPKKRKAATE